MSSVALCRLRVASTNSKTMLTALFQFSDQILLQRGESLNSTPSYGHKLIHFLLGKGGPFRRALDFDVAPLAGHDDIHINFGYRVFGIGQIHEDLPTDFSHTNGSEVIRQRAFLDQTLLFEDGTGIGQGDKRPCDCLLYTSDAADERSSV